MVTTVVHVLRARDQDGKGVCCIFDLPPLLVQQVNGVPASQFDYRQCLCADCEVLMYISAVCVCL